MTNVNLPNNNARFRQRRKRARPCTARTNHISICKTSRGIPKATLITSLLWLVAFTATQSSHVVKAFVLTNDRPSYCLTTSTTLNKQPSTTTSAPIFAATLADFEMDTGSAQRNMNDLISFEEERPEDVLDLSSLPLLLVPNNKNGQQAKIPDEEEVLEWAERYTSVEALREHFGTNQNKLWGDLQASTARRLYKTLLPRALLELSKLGKVHPKDLAPLAYQARVAAKLYARERCTVPARLAATLFDGFRQWIKYGKFQAAGMTYDQLWEKYAEKILHETEVDHYLHRPDAVIFRHHHGDDDEEECYPFDCDCEDLSEQVCLKILERACVSNEGVDALALKGKDWADDTELQPHQRALLEQIRSQLSEDMYQLLLPRPGHEEEEEDKLPELHGLNRNRDQIRRGKFRLVKGLARKRRFWKLQQARKKRVDTEKPWKKSRSKPWLSRSKKLDSDEKTAVTSSDDDQLNP